MTAHPGKWRLEVERLLLAAQAVVFRAFSAPDQLASWWGPEGFVTPSLEFARALASGTGPKCSRLRGILSVSRGSSARSTHPPASQTFSWDPPDPDDLETLVELSFRDLKESMVVGLIQGPFKTEARRELHRNGMSASSVPIAVTTRRAGASATSLAARERSPHGRRRAR
jgi:uncharacterized protein YndB with AHSA1/START domain